MFEKIPYEMKKCCNWVCWNAIPDEKSHSGIKKVPVCALNGSPAKSNDPSTWTTFDNALIVKNAHNFSGVGFMFGDSDYFGVDIDDCRDEVERYLNGDKSGIIGEFIETLGSYAEISQSGNGIHIICKGTLPEGVRRKGKVEMYDSGRYFIMTGNQIGHFDEIRNCTESIKNLHEKYLGSTKKTVVNKSTPVEKMTETEIIAKMCNSSAKAERLYKGDWSAYPSQSEADMAFCSILAFWCGGDTMLMDSIYRNSWLMRDKWDRRTSGSTYGRILMEKCVNECTEFYNPKKDGYKITIGKSTDVEIKMRTLDDTGNAQRMNDLCGDVVKFNYTDNCFVYYTDGKWKCDNRGVVLGYADEVLERLKMELKQWTELDGGAYLQDYHKHCKKSRSNAAKRAMVREFEHLVPVAPSDFDSDKLLVNAQNGVIDLKTGQIVPHSPDLLMTRMLGTSLPESPKKPEKWLNFLSETFGGSDEMVRYIQKLTGYMLSGETSEQCVFFMFGNGSNGKSVLLEVLRRLLGDYSTNVQPESIMIKQNSGGANSDIARLKGARFVTCTEPNEGARLNEGLIKQMTGGDVMTARKLYGNEFEFKPEFKFCMATNHKPTIRGTDYGVWRRMRIIPFDFTVPENRKDPALVDKLAQELPEILAWAVEGYKLWRTEGLKSPACVEEAGKEYRNEMDVISAFLDSEYVQSGGECKSGVLYALYCKWADDNNEYKMSSTKFGREIGKRYNKIQKRDTSYYQGISTVSITIG